MCYCWWIFNLHFWQLIRLIVYIYIFGMREIEGFYLSISLSLCLSRSHSATNEFENSTNHVMMRTCVLNVSNAIRSTKITIYLKPFGFSVKQIVSLSNYSSVYFYYTQARYFQYIMLHALCRVLQSNEFTKIALVTTK